MELFLTLLIWVLLGASTAYVARQRGRDPILWFVIGLLLGIFGVILVFILPVVAEEESEEQQLPSSSQIKPSLLFSTSKYLPNDYLTKQWFYLDDANKQEGPVSFNVLKDKWNTGVVSNQSFVWCEDMTDWRSIKELELFL